MSKSINILSTKKLLTNQKQLLLDANFSVFDKNYIEKKLKIFDVPNNINEISGLLFSSKNAVKSILQHPKKEELKAINAFCVGIKTKELLIEKGFNIVAYTDYASDLAKIITLIYSNEKYLFFCGNLRRDDLPKMLIENKVNFKEIEVYQTKLTSHKNNKKVDGILFFSPSAVESYLKLNAIKEEMCFCIGETTAKALENKKIKNIIIANQPTVENVISAVIEFYN